MSISPEDFGKARNSLLVEIYRSYLDAPRNLFYNYREIGASIGLEKEMIDAIVKYWTDDYCLEFRSIGMVKITKLGIDRAEELLCADTGANKSVQTPFKFEQTITNSNIQIGDSGTQVVRTNIIDSEIKKESRLSRILVGVAIAVISGVVLYFLGIKR